MTDISVPDVSFVIAAYNAEETLARAIDSALAQQGVTVEVIVVDDCSIDRTREIAAGYDDVRVRLVAQERNGGPGAARNAGIAAAGGRWLAVLDSDDALYPTRMEQMIARAEEAGAEIAVDNIEVEPADGKRIRMFPESMLSSRPVLTFADFIASNTLFDETHNFGYMKPIFSRPFIERHGIRYDELLRIGEDYIFLASALANGGKCVVEPSVGYIYYIREGSISRILELRHVDAMIAGDERFLRAHTLNAEAQAAQKLRARSLREARAFLMLVDAIKQKSIRRALSAAWQEPRAIRHLAMPIAARLRRVAAPFRRPNPPASINRTADLPSLGGGPHSSKG